MSKREITVGLAPMEGVTDHPFRIWSSLASSPADMTTPFLRATQSYPQRSLDPEFAPELTSAPQAFRYRLVPQIMAAESEPFLRAAELFLRYAPYVELNAGCPSPTCTGRGAGSSLLADADTWRRLLLRLSEALGPGRLAVKMRTGYHHAGELPVLLSALADLPLRRLTLHGRTRPERYTGLARWDLIEQSARSMRFPVIASGDVVDRASFLRLRRVAPSIGGVIIGRGAMRDPFVFLSVTGQGGEGEENGHALPRLLIPQALACYGLLVELASREPGKLLKLSDKGLWLHPAHLQVSIWDGLIMQLSGALGAWPASPRDYQGLPITRGSLGRMKMLWNYWRSSLPTSMFSPQTMRAREPHEFLEAIAQLAARVSAEQWIPCYQRGYDWIYAGGKRPHQADEACAPSAK